MVGGLVSLVWSDPTRGGRPGETIVGLNPLITDDAIRHRLTLATCDQLAQSVLKIGFALVKKADRGRWAGFSTGCRAHGSRLGWL